MQLTCRLGLSAALLPALLALLLFLLPKSLRTVRWPAGSSSGGSRALALPPNSSSSARRLRQPHWPPLGQLCLPQALNQLHSVHCLPQPRQHRAAHRVWVLLEGVLPGKQHPPAHLGVHSRAGC